MGLGPVNSMERNKMLRQTVLFEEPNWPTPYATPEVSGFRSVQLHLKRLSMDARFVCAIVAVEIVLPIWEDGYPDEPVVLNTLETVRDWLNNDPGVGPTELQEGMEACHEAADNASREESPHAEAVAWGTRRLAQAANYEESYGASPTSNEDWTTIDLTHVVQNAANATLPQWDRVPLDTPEGAEFLNHWWSECRKRLAFRYVDRMALSGRF